MKVYILIYSYYLNEDEGIVSIHSSLESAKAKLLSLVKDQDELSNDCYSLNEPYGKRINIREFDVSD